MKICVKRRKSCFLGNTKLDQLFGTNLKKHILQDFGSISLFLMFFQLLSTWRFWLVFGACSTLHLSLFFQAKNLILAASAVVDSAPTTTSWATRRSAQKVKAVTWCPCPQIPPLALLSTLQTALRQLALQLPQHQLVQRLVLLIFVEFIRFWI